MRVVVFGEVGDLGLAAAAAADDEVVNGLSWQGIIDRTPIHFEFWRFRWSVFFICQQPELGPAFFFVLSSFAWIDNDLAFLELVLG